MWIHAAPDESRVPAPPPPLRRGPSGTIRLAGLEQTNESVSLPTYPFPAHCVLLLGREKEGIPVGLLGLLDTCVEIPQLGVIRSLNVHVSGAIAVYEYTRQQRERLANGAPPPPQ